VATITHLPADCSASDIVAVIAEQGAVIVNDLGPLGYYEYGSPEVLFNEDQ
jgi:hypothetical protein